MDVSTLLQSAFELAIDSPRNGRDGPPKTDLWPPQYWLRRIDHGRIYRPEYQRLT